MNALLLSLKLISTEHVFLKHFLASSAHILTSMWVTVDFAIYLA